MAAGTGWGGFPKACIFEYYQKLTGVPTFETERHGGTSDLPFLCTLTCPAVETPKGIYEECKFRAAGRSKKAAEHAASEKALEFIRSKGLLPEPVVDAAPPSAAALGDEVRALNEKVTLLSSKVAAAVPLPSNCTVVVIPAPGSAEPFDVEADPMPDIGAMTVEELRTALAQARAANAQLRAELKQEHARRMNAVKVLSDAAASEPKPPAEARPRQEE
ncbi:hypothetical protein WJX81_003086 [Elliptochloris bilobata]|uniref:DRBM domain-containing protein n=1 Tax=Elliptochloris bilobata TaxID=381761 RepID=A0AAW1RYQ2_9CHLO